VALVAKALPVAVAPAQVIDRSVPVHPAAIVPKAKVVAVDPAVKAASARIVPIDRLVRKLRPNRALPLLDGEGHREG
jgi:hypothetical protein